MLCGPRICRLRPALRPTWDHDPKPVIQLDAPGGTITAHDGINRHAPYSTHRFDAVLDKHSTQEEVYARCDQSSGPHSWDACHRADAALPAASQVRCRPGGAFPGGLQRHAAGLRADRVRQDAHHGHKRCAHVF